MGPVVGGGDAEAAVERPPQCLGRTEATAVGDAVEGDLLGLQDVLDGLDAGLLDVATGRDADLLGETSLEVTWAHVGELGERRDAEVAIGSGVDVALHGADGVGGGGVVTPTR